MNYSEYKHIPAGHSVIKLEYSLNINGNGVGFFQTGTGAKEPVLRNAIGLSFLATPHAIEQIKGEILEHLNHFTSSTVTKAAQMQQIDSSHWNIQTNYCFSIKQDSSDREAFLCKGDSYYNKPCDTSIEAIKGLISEHVNEFSGMITAKLNSYAAHFTNV